MVFLSSSNVLVNLRWLRRRWRKLQKNIKRNAEKTHNLCMSTATLRKCWQNIMFYQDERIWGQGLFCINVQKKNPSKKIPIFHFLQKIRLRWVYYTWAIAITFDDINWVNFPHSFSPWLNFQLYLKPKKFKTERKKHNRYLLSFLNMWWNSYLSSNVSLCCFSRLSWSFDLDKSQTSGLPWESLQCTYWTMYILTKVLLNFINYNKSMRTER